MTNVWMDADEMAYKLAAACETVYVKYDGQVFKNKTFAKANVDDYDESLLTSHFDVVDDWEAKAQTNLDWKMKGIKYWVKDMKPTLVFGDKSFRHEIARMQEYKGARKSTRRPALLGEVKQWLKSNYLFVDARDDYEGDDALVISCLEHGGVIVSSDKDLFTTPCLVMPLDNPKRPVDCNSLGGLHINASGTVKGFGRKLFYFQLLFGDMSDCYRPFVHSATLKKYGQVGVFKDLSSLNTDQACVDLILKKYQKAYSEPFSFVDWEGVSQTYNWEDVLRETLDMAYMRRFYGDRMTVDRFIKSGGV
jgi:hypothetical protein